VSLFENSPGPVGRVRTRARHPCGRRSAVCRKPLPLPGLSRPVKLPDRASVFEAVRIIGLLPLLCPSSSLATRCARPAPGKICPRPVAWSNLVKPSQTIKMRFEAKYADFTIHYSKFSIPQWMPVMVSFVPVQYRFSTGYDRLSTGLAPVTEGYGRFPAPFVPGNNPSTTANVSRRAF
jgi:hypothetical protein